jgi:hypothetical protein
VEESVQEESDSADPLNFGITLVVRVGAKAPRESWIRASVNARCADIESVRNVMSPGKKARKLGTPLAPFGDMKAWFADCDEKLAAMVPEVVIGPPVTVNTELGKVTLTEETLPPPPPMLNRTARLSPRTFVAVAMLAFAGGLWETVKAPWTIAEVTMVAWMGNQSRRMKSKISLRMKASRMKRR